MVNGGHKKNIWEFCNVPNMYWNAINVFICPLDCLSYVFWGVGDLSAIWAASALRRFSVITEIKYESPIKHPKDIRKTVKRVSEYFYCILVHIRDIVEFPYILLMSAINHNLGFLWSYESFFVIIVLWLYEENRKLFLYLSLSSNQLKKYIYIVHLWFLVVITILSRRWMTVIIEFYSGSEKITFPRFDNDSI